jgi:rSAM/selenodomain-associated transferase 2
MNTKISIIVPVLNEAATLEATLSALQPLRQRGHEVLVVDGGSRDSTVSIARKHADRVLMSGPGRALQMNTGADSSEHPILLFLHADTHLPANADALIHHALSPQSSIWGRFDIRLSGKRKIFRILERSINLRTAISGIATGDQAIFVTRRFFERVGYYDGLPLLEDVALSKKLLTYGWPQRIKTPVLTSSRKWETNGVMRTILLMWRIRTAYFFGVHPDVLVQHYYSDRKEQGPS